MATGKISRLPREIREQLNRRLDDGEPGNRLVIWHNELPVVRTLLAAEFNGSAINEQNLTNWKQGGYRDWRMQQEAQVLVQTAARTANPPVVTTEQLSTVLSARYVMAFREWQEEPMPVNRRWRQLRVMVRDVSKLRRDEQRKEWRALQGERRDFQNSLTGTPKECANLGKSD